MIKQSSKEAYAITTYFNRDAESRKKILDFMLESKSSDFTRGEIATALAMPINRITPRVLELIQNGDLVELGRRKSVLSNVKCHALALSDQFRDVA